MSTPELDEGVYRAWINQPSTRDRHHQLHGKYGIAVDRGGPNVTLHFAEGPVHSMVIPRHCISRVYICAAHRDAVRRSKEKGGRHDPHRNA